MRRTPAFMFLVWGLLACSWSGSPCAGQQQAVPLQADDLITLLDLGIEEPAIVSKLKASGIGFQPDPVILDRLKQAGASPAVLAAVQEAGRPKPAQENAGAGGPPPITYADVLKLLQLKIDEQAIRQRLEKSITVFQLSAEQAGELKAAGASQELIAALQRPRQASPAAAELITDVMLILDSSGSMREMTEDGQVKMDVARQVVTDLIQNIPEGLRVGFVVYGHEVFGAPDDPRNCQAVSVLRPMLPLNAPARTELAGQIAQLEPKGATPIALALQVAGKELARNPDAYCGVVLITDGLESCKGNPAEEAAALQASLKLDFGVNVVGLGVSDVDDAALKAIADAGHGKYFNADTARELTAALVQVSAELEKAARPPAMETSNRRAIRVLRPEVEFPECQEIQVVSLGLGSVTVDAQGHYGDEIRIPSGTASYEIRWIPAKGEPVAMLSDFTLSERRVVEIRPEELLGMIRVNGTGRPQSGIEIYRRGLGSTVVLQRAESFGEIMVVPVGKVNIRVDGEDIEVDFEVEPGTLHDLE